MSADEKATIQAHLDAINPKKIKHRLATASVYDSVGSVGPDAEESKTPLVEEQKPWTLNVHCRDTHGQFHAFSLLRVLGSTRWDELRALVASRLELRTTSRLHDAAKEHSYSKPQHSHT